MSYDLDVVMVGSAPSIAGAIDAILQRLAAIQFQLPGTFRDMGSPPGRRVRFDEDWKTAVNGWNRASFEVTKTGSMMHVRLQRVTGGALRAEVGMSARLLCHLFTDGGRHDPEFYAPVLQIAVALNARAGVGDFDWELEDFQPGSERAVEKAVWETVESDATRGRLCFLRQDPRKPTPGGKFVVTERPEGYWLLEHPTLLRFLAD